MKRSIIDGAYFQISENGQFSITYAGMCLLSLGLITHLDILYRKIPSYELIDMLEQTGRTLPNKEDAQKYLIEKGYVKITKKDFN